MLRCRGLMHAKNFDTVFNHLETNPMTYRLFGILLLFFSPVAAFPAEIMFEGYYRVELEGKPIGYTILRYEFEPKTKMFEAKSFLRVKFGDKIVQESTKAKATDKFKPI